MITAVCLLNFSLIMAQDAHFTVAGTIEFEKKINTYALLKRKINKDNESYMQQVYDNYRKTQAQFKILKSTLTFTSNQMVFSPVEDDAPLTNNYLVQDPMIEQYNTVFTDLLNGTSIVQKKVFEKTFLIKDSRPVITWKITNEIREIAGYSCRRANAVILDSVYVVAFYTTKIIVPGGPESFSGLPGMILGVALPHENISWFATKVTDMPIAPTTIIPPGKGEPINRKELRTILEKSIKDDEHSGKMLLKAELL